MAHASDQQTLTSIWTTATQFLPPLTQKYTLTFKEKATARIEHRQRAQGFHSCPTPRTCASAESLQDCVSAFLLRILFCSWASRHVQDCAASVSEPSQSQRGMQASRKSLTLQSSLNEPSHPQLELVSSLEYSPAKENFRQAHQRAWRNSSILRTQNSRPLPVASSEHSNVPTDCIWRPPNNHHNPLLGNRRTPSLRSRHSQTSKHKSTPWRLPTP